MKLGRVEGALGGPKLCPGPCVSQNIVNCKNGIFLPPTPVQLEISHEDPKNGGYALPNASGLGV